MGVLWNVLNKALKENANALISEYNGFKHMVIYC